MGNSPSRPSSSSLLRRRSAAFSSTSSVSSFERLPRDKGRRRDSHRSLEHELEAEAPRPLRVGYPYYEEVRREAELKGRRRGGKRFSF